VSLRRRRSERTNSPGALDIGVIGWSLESLDTGKLPGTDSARRCCLERSKVVTAWYLQPWAPALHLERVRTGLDQGFVMLVPLLPKARLEAWKSARKSWHGYRFAFWTT
jgi:hypothetical protein